jgi:hypothetical protein
MAASRPKCGKCAKFAKCWGANNPRLDDMTPEARENAMKGYAQATAAPACFEERNA